MDPDLVARATEAALGEADRLGCSHAEVRVERIRSQMVALRDDRLETAADDTELGVGLRVVHDGSMGFAATVALGTDEAAALAGLAVDAARTTARAGRRRVELADEPGHGRVTWASPHRTDPVTVPLADKVALLEGWSRRLLDAPVVDHVTASLLCVAEEKHFCDLAGTTATQQRVRVHPQASVLAVEDDGGFEEMRTVAPPVGRGWEYLEGDGWDWEAELASLPDLLAAKLGAPSVEPGPYDLVIDPTNLWLTIHESIGHATELDRALGYEAAYAGTSFATPDRLGSLRYGSPIMQVTGDRTVEHGLATVAVDDEGVAGQTFDLVRDGVLVGYQLDRAIAGAIGATRSNGCAFADSPLHVPIQRMANVSLQPADGEGPTTEDLIAGVERGLYIVGDKSWSIDMQRDNFQFTGQRFFAVEGGRLAGQVRDVAYQATTTDFWGSMDAVGGRSTYLLGGAFNCGKGQPGQVAPVSHGCPSALFRGVRVLNTRQELRPVKPPQVVAEEALAAAGGDCVVLVEESSEAEVRFANNTTTTNGVRLDRRVTVIRFADVDGGVAAGMARRGGDVDPADLVAAATADARSGAAADDAQPLLSGDADPTYGEPPGRTDLGALGGVLAGLSGAFARAGAGGRVLSGFAEHRVATTYLASTTGLRHRHVQPTGALHLVGRSEDGTRSAWAGAGAPGFDEQALAGLEERVGRGLGWAGRRVELDAGRYEVVLPPAAVADLMVGVVEAAGGREAEEGRTVFSAPGGGTRVGDTLASLPFDLWSDPVAEGLECAPFLSAAASSSDVSVFDNGLPIERVDWVADGELRRLRYHRAGAARAGVPVTPPVDNLVLELPGASGSVEELVARTERGLLLTCLWYIREVDPATLLLTGLTRDGVYVVTDGEVVGTANNFRFNESPVDLLARTTEAGSSVRALGREFGEWVNRTRMPALRVPDFNMSSVSQAS